MSVRRCPLASDGLRLVVFVAGVAATAVGAVAGAVGARGVAAVSLTVAGSCLFATVVLTVLFRSVDPDVPGEEAP